MNITAILTAAGIVATVGILIGILLGIASEKFKVEVDDNSPKGTFTFTLDKIFSI